jgi:hypothetical protein
MNLPSLVYLELRAVLPPANGDAPPPQTTWALTAPQWGAHVPPTPQPVLGMHDQPGQHWLELVQVGAPAHHQFSTQTQVASALMKQ